MHCRLCKSQSQWTSPTNRFSKWILQTIRFCTDKAPAYPTAYAANAASMQPQGRYVNCKLGTYWGFRGQPKSAQIVQIVQTSTQVVLTLKYNLFLGILLPKLFWPTVRKKCSRNPEKPFDVRGWRLRICNILEITTLYFSTKHKKTPEIINILGLPI